MIELFVFLIFISFTFIVPAITVNKIMEDKKNYIIINYGEGHYNALWVGCFCMVYLFWLFFILLSSLIINGFYYI